ncbi:hypothetical protein [Paenibacillus hamazuiensis]|uniref:hypothetical protein n=1 Tax=Paenibacillus hamazuiensis TaxID=2936508 RepID=UPI00200BAA88|nr:hypothetical protein [Paenibacillus hamazuiensis]
MIGSIRLNLVIAFITFICTFLFSFSSNIWTTTLLRSLYGFVTVFVLVFLFRWVLGTVVGLNKFQSGDESGEGVPDEAGKGVNLDVVTPEEQDSIHQMLKDNLSPKPEQEEDPGFSPLSPPKLKKNVDLEPEDLAKALRQMSEE